MRKTGQKNIKSGGKDRKLIKMQINKGHRQGGQAGIKEEGSQARQDAQCRCTFWSSQIREASGTLWGVGAAFWASHQQFQFKYFLENRVRSMELFRIGGRAPTHTILSYFQKSCAVEENAEVQEQMYHVFFLILVTQGSGWVGTPGKVYFRCEVFGSKIRSPSDEKR